MTTAKRRPRLVIRVLIAIGILVWLPVACAVALGRSYKRKVSHG